MESLDIVKDIRPGLIPRPALAMKSPGTRTAQLAAPPAQHIGIDAQFSGHLTDPDI